MNAGSTGGGITRVRYRERQLLRTDDLVAEQAYRLAMQRRHQIAHHRWGIVRGLGVTPDGAGVMVRPGLAVDGYGRLLLLPAPRAISPDHLRELEDDRIDVWLVYTLRCQPGQPGRVSEGARLLLTSAPPDPTDPRVPVKIPSGGQDFGPERTPPDEPERPWPVYLARLTRNDGSWTVSGDRALVSLVGESVAAASRRAEIQVGAERVGDPRRFAVWVRGPDGTLVEQFAIQGDGATSIAGHATLDANLTLPPRAATSVGVEDGAPVGVDGDDTRPRRDPAWGIAFRPSGTPVRKAGDPEPPAPWRIYSAVVKSERSSTSQLRFEIEQPGEERDPAGYRLAIGQAVADHPANVADAAGADLAAPKPQRFAPLLSVSADCTVTIHGPLNIKGQMLLAPVKPDPGDPRFSNALIGQWARGLSGSTATLDAIGRTKLSITVEALEIVNPGGKLEYTVELFNSGSQPISSILVVQNVAVDDAGVPGLPTEIGSGIGLAPQQRRRIPRSLDVPADAHDEIDIAVSALGVGPANVTVGNTASKTVDIVPVVP